MKTFFEKNEPTRRPSSEMVAFVGKPSDITTKLPIAKSSLDSSFCKSARIESSSSPNLLTELFLLATSCLRPSVLQDALVF